MTRIVVRRVLRSLIVFIVASILVFVALRMVPGDPQGVSAAERASRGLDDQAPIQYLDFIAPPRSFPIAKGLLLGAEHATARRGARLSPGVDRMHR